MYAVPMEVGTPQAYENPIFEHPQGTLPCLRVCPRHRSRIATTQHGRARACVFVCACVRVCVCVCVGRELCVYT